jgi:hypothetical protein
MSPPFRIMLMFSVTISFIFLTNSATTKQSTNFGYCMSDPGHSPVYFSNVIDFGTNGLIDTNAIQNEFDEYLRGRFETRTSGPFGAQCPTSGHNMQEATVQRRDYQNQLRQSNKQIVEVDWTWVVDPDLVAAAGQQHRMPRPGLQLPVDNSFCFSQSFAGTLYVAGPVQTGSSVSMANFNIGFTQYLKQVYSFQDKVNCNMGTRKTATRLVNAHIQGARAANKKVVETDWHFESNVTPVTQQQDEDREPTANRPSVLPQVSQTELQQARAEANRERPLTSEFCRKDPALSKVFSCANFSQAVFAYRVAHRADSGATEPVERLVEDAKFPCTGCIDGTQVLIWVRRRALEEKINPKSQQCIVSTLTKTLNSNTSQVRRHLEEFYKSAVSACNQ